MTRLEPGRIAAVDVGRRFRLTTAGGRSLRASLLGRERVRPRELWAVRHVDLDIAPGEAFGIVGRNGSGKSTLLKMLARIYGPSEGSCAVGGRLSSLLELGAGFHPEFSAIENVYLSAAIYGIPRAEIREQIDSVIGFAELETFAHQPVKTFSSGMFARLGFSVAMHVRPDVLLLDEVLAVGDEAFVQKCLGRIAEYRRDGGTMILVTHDPVTVQRVCDRALLLEHGEPAAMGPAAEVIATYHAHLARDTGREAEKDGRSRTEGAFEVSVEVVDATGDTRRSYTEGEPFSVRLRVMPHIDLTPAEVNIEFKDTGGRPLTGNTTPDVRFTAGEPREFALDVPTPPFRDGVFAIAVSICDGTTLEARYLEDAQETIVVIADSRHTGGSIRLGATWRA